MLLTDRRSRRFSARRMRAGFTLLELIVAIAIFVGAAATLSRLILLGLEFSEYTRDSAIASRLADQKLSELEAGIVTVQDTGSYRFDDYPDWQYSLSADEIDDRGLFLIRVEITKLNTNRFPPYKISRLYFDESTASSSVSSDSTTGTTP